MAMMKVRQEREVNSIQCSLVMDLKCIALTLGKQMAGDRMGPLWIPRD